MYGMDIHTTIKTLLAKGTSRRKIATQMGLHRKVIKRIEQGIATGSPPRGYIRNKKLSGLEDLVRGFISSELTAELIHQKLAKDHSLSVSYTTVSRFVRELKADRESFVPMHSAAGEEAQVDFGYLGVFRRADGKSVKVWVFCMVLSHSRLGYFEAVTDQSVETFIRCHIRAFEAFCGVPQMVRLDNLKAGVTVPDFYEPLIQQQYAMFLAHYAAAAIPCRVRTPEHKGKVESGVKYVKNNFLRGLGHRDFDRLDPDLREWSGTVANRRTHGTTKRVPFEVWDHTERDALLPLPLHRYEFYHVEERKVTRFGHVTFQNNYYSVPCSLVGQTLRLHSNGSLLRISHDGQEVALHRALNGEKGMYVTQTAHLPLHKQPHGPEYYAERLEREIGPEALDMMRLMQLYDSSHWKEKVRGLLHLCRAHPPERVREACRRALEHGIYSYRSVRDICLILEHTPQQHPQQFQAPPNAGGMAHDLSIYDQIAR